MVAILLGAPGSGKGTQSKALCAKYGFKHLSTGDIFRGEIAAKTSLGLKAEEYVKAGKLVPDTIVTEMVAAKLDYANGDYLLDGFPRNLDQAQALARFLAASQGAVDLVVLLKLPKAEALKRLTARRVCSSCGEVYNLNSLPTRAEGICNSCGGAVIQREDDGEATASRRLMVFEDLTEPLVTYYKAEQVFQEVDADQSPEKVSQSIFAIVNSTLAVR